MSSTIESKKSGLNFTIVEDGKNIAFFAPSSFIPKENLEDAIERW